MASSRSTIFKPSLFANPTLLLPPGQNPTVGAERETWQHGPVSRYDSTQVQGIVRYLYKHAGRIVAGVKLVTGPTTAGSAIVTEVYVLPKRRLHGIGARLHDEITKEFRLSRYDSTRIGLADWFNLELEFAYAWDAYQHGAYPSAAAFAQHLRDILRDLDWEPENIARLSDAQLIEDAKRNADSVHNRLQGD